MVAVGLVVFLLPVVLVTQVVILKRMSRRPAGHEAEERAAAPAAPEAKPKPSLVDDPGAAPPASAVDPLPDLLAGLIRSHLTQTYYNLGFLADGYDKLYTPEKAVELFNEIQDTMDSVEGQLKRIPLSRLDSTGRVRLQRARELMAMLHAQANELASYWETADKEHIERFQKVRTEAWTAICAYLADKK
jgi:hypothetical protein